MMALRALLITMIIAAAAATPALAVDHVVGGNLGWNRGVDYTSWAQGKDFHVGDSLTFMYTPGAHNIISVNNLEFQTCKKPNTTEKNHKSGNDVLPLVAPGKKWYISSIIEDCDNGMKLAITVSAAEGPAPSPIPGALTPPPGTLAASGASALRSFVWMVVVVAVAICKMIMA